jgi:hypothetical protein
VFSRKSAQTIEGKRVMANFGFARVRKSMKKKKLENSSCERKGA